MNPRSPRRTALAAIIPLLAAGQTGPIQRQEALDLLAAQTQAWNRGDLPGFVSFYNQCLTFLGAGALLLGRYYLDRREPAEGYFTLILEQTPAGLEITHDHTTAAAENPGP